MKKRGAGAPRFLFVTESGGSDITPAARPGTAQVIDQLHAGRDICGGSISQEITEGAQPQNLSEKLCETDAA